MGQGMQGDGQGIICGMLMVGDMLGMHCDGMKGMQEGMQGFMPMFIGMLGMDPDRKEVPPLLVEDMDCGMQEGEGELIIDEGMHASFIGSIWGAEQNMPLFIIVCGVLMPFIIPII